MCFLSASGKDLRNFGQASLQFATITRFLFAGTVPCYGPAQLPGQASQLYDRHQSVVRRSVPIHCVPSAAEHLRPIRIHTLCGIRVRLAAGHFFGLPALPVAVLVGVAYQTLKLHGPDLQNGFTVVEGKMTCSRLVRLGETLQLASHRQPGNKFLIEIFAADGTRVATVAPVVQLP